MSGSQRPLQNRVTPFGDVIARRLAMFWGLSPPYPSSGEAMVVLRGTESLLTHRWREMDSNQWYGGTEKLPSAAPVSGPTLPRMPQRGIMTSQPPGMRGMSAGLRMPENPSDLA